MRKQPIAAHSDLAPLVLEGQLCAWDVSRWQWLQADPGAAPQAGCENYRVGYVASEV